MAATASLTCSPKRRNAPPPPFGSGILFDQILVGGTTSLLNLIIHALLFGGMVWTVRRLEPQAEPTNS